MGELRRGRMRARFAARHRAARLGSLHRRAAGGNEKGLCRRARDRDRAEARHAHAARAVRPSGDHDVPHRERLLRLPPPGPRFVRARHPRRSRAARFPGERHVVQPRARSAGRFRRAGGSQERCPPLRRRPRRALPGGRAAHFARAALRGAVRSDHRGENRRGAAGKPGAAAQYFPRAYFLGAQGHPLRARRGGDAARLPGGVLCDSSGACADAGL